MDIKSDMINFCIIINTYSINGCFNYNSGCGRSGKLIINGSFI